MLSRVADSIYWMARYIERAENIARFIEVTLNLSLDLPQGLADQWQPLVLTTGDEEMFRARYGEPTGDWVIRFLTFDAEYPNSIVSSLRAARENARTVREAISSESWEQLNEFYHQIQQMAERELSLQSLNDLYRSIRLNCQLFNGVLDATMLRGPAWHFANLGRLCERADKTSRILDVKYFTLLPSIHDVGTTLDDLQWSAVLKSVSGLEMYRKRYRVVTVHRVVEFLILDEAFPRAIHYALKYAEISLGSIVGCPAADRTNEVTGRVAKLRSRLVAARVDDIVQSGLHQFVDQLQSELNQIHSSIHETFF